MDRKRKRHTYESGTTIYLNDMAVNGENTHKQKLVRENNLTSNEKVLKIEKVIEHVWACNF